MREIFYLLDGSEVRDAGDVKCWGVGKDKECSGMRLPLLGRVDSPALTDLESDSQLSSCSFSFRQTQNKPKMLQVWNTGSNF